MRNAREPLGSCVLLPVKLSAFSDSRERQLTIICSESEKRDDREVELNALTTTGALEEKICGEVSSMSNWTRFHYNLK